MASSARVVAGKAALTSAVLLLGIPASLPVLAEEKPKPLVFCAEPVAMPRTGKATDGSPRGLDMAVGRLICKNLGRTFEVHWCSSASCSRRCLREKRCDVILGHPLDEGAPKDINDQECQDDQHGRDARCGGAAQSASCRAAP